MPDLCQGDSIIITNPCDCCFPPGQDIEALGHSDSKDVGAKLRLGLISALAGYAKRGTQEAKDIVMSAGALCMEGGVLDKVSGEPLLALAVEKTLLRLLLKNKKVVMLLRERGSFALKTLNEQVADLKDYRPDQDDEDDDDEEEGDEEEEIEEEIEEEEDDDDDEDDA